MIHFANPWFLLLIPPVVGLVIWKRKVSSLGFSSVALLKTVAKGLRFKHRIGKYLVATAMVCFVIALARPQIELPRQASPEDALDIAMVLDVSGSMASVDFEPSRLEVAKETMVDFAEKRGGDRLAFIVFAGTAYTKIPLTFDHQMIVQSIHEVDLSSVKEEGTAIGMAMSVGVNRLKKSDASSKVMILVTDGDNNAGTINPNTASNLSKELGIKVYTIGVGTDETIIPYSYFGTTKYQSIEGGLNETLLKQIAEVTGGSYYRAQDGQALQAIFDEINQLETTEFQRENKKSYDELAFPLMETGVIILLIGLYFDRYRYLQLP